MQKHRRTPHPCAKWILKEKKSVQEEEIKEQEENYNSTSQLSKAIFRRFSILVKDKGRLEYGTEFGWLPRKAVIRAKLMNKTLLGCGMGIKMKLLFHDRSSAV